MANSNRTITVISTQGNQTENVSSSATTWGDLKSDIKNQTSFNTDDAKAIIKGLRTSLTENTDVLPEGDFSIFLTPSKIKSGNN